MCKMAQWKRHLRVDFGMCVTMKEELFYDITLVWLLKPPHLDLILRYLNYYFHLHVCPSTCTPAASGVTLQRFIPLIAPEARN